VVFIPYKQRQNDVDRLIEVGTDEEESEKAASIIEHVLFPILKQHNAREVGECLSYGTEDLAHLCKRQCASATGVLHGFDKI
jgi:predicted lipoprotein